MSAATITPVPRPPRPAGATPVLGSHHHVLGEALRAVKVFAGAAFDVVILGEYGEEAGVRRKFAPAYEGVSSPSAARPRP